MGRMCEPTDGIPQTPIYTFLNFDLEILNRTQFEDENCVQIGQY